MKPAMKLRFTNDAFDQWRASEVGALIGFNRRGEPEYQFETWEQYQNYLALNAKRKEFEERRKQT